MGIAGTSEMLQWISASSSFIPLESTNQSSPWLVPLSFGTAMLYLYSFSLPPAASLMGSVLLLADPFLTPLYFIAEMWF